MMNVLSRLRGRKSPSSREIAKQRLQLVLVHDRSQISPGLLEMLKDEIIAVISKHIEIDPGGVQVSFSQTERESRLVADIPLADGRRVHK
ncbi:MAG TPA: cell division topological specificity factor MinE [Anaerolineae bacterium]|nr:cell division topological specificity factor MinE [Anaerolineae bacterium]